MRDLANRVREFPHDAQCALWLARLSELGGWLLRIRWGQRVAINVTTICTR